jgi:hypothetical protein
VFDEPGAIAWKPGTESPETGELNFGGWIWRCDLAATGPSQTTVTLTYDWSAVPPAVREYLQFPPFGQDHLDNSVQHLSNLVAGNRRHSCGSAHAADTPNRGRTRAECAPTTPLDPNAVLLVSAK